MLHEMQFVDEGLIILSADLLIQKAKKMFVLEMEAEVYTDNLSDAEKPERDLLDFEIDYDKFCEFYIADHVRYEYEEECDSEEYMYQKCECDYCKKFVELDAKFGLNFNVMDEVPDRCFGGACL